MKVLGLQFENCRNLINNYIEPCGKVNVIYGENAQGKTNLLELIWIFTGFASFRGSKDSELIAFNKDYAKIEIKFYSEDREQTAQIKIYNGKKEILINGVSKPTANFLTEKFSAVVFSPEHLTLVKNGPSTRRKFLDNAICHQSPKISDTLSKYNQTLNQRNALLKEIYKNKNLKETLPIWDEALSAFGAVIIKERLNYIKKLNKKASFYHNGISNNKEVLDILYLSDTSYDHKMDVLQIQNKLFNALKKCRHDDYTTGYTNAGPHRDDVDFIINGIKAKTYASQGQQRSIVLSVKLAEASILYNKTGEKPIILLDDVLSELDNNRQEFLLNKIEEYQVFVTCCEKSNKEQLKKGKVFYIENGKIDIK